MWFDVCMFVLTMMVDEHKDQDMSSVITVETTMHKDVHEELQLCCCLFWGAKIYNYVIKPLYSSPTSIYSLGSRDYLMYTSVYIKYYCYLLATPEIVIAFAL